MDGKKDQAKRGYMCWSVWAFSPLGLFFPIEYACYVWKIKNWQMKGSIGLKLIWDQLLVRKGQLSDLLDVYVKGLSERMVILYWILVK